jgi:4-amino-4-deoxy-L-arabinose transferase-like glycosyltransferase
MADRLERLARRRTTWIVLLSLALVVRLGFVLTAPRALLWSDGRHYEAIGWRLAAEGRYTGDAILPPLYPAFIAGVYAIAGRDVMALRVVEAVISTGTVALVGAGGVALLGGAAGLIAAALASFHPVLAFLPVTQHVDNLLVFLATLGFTAFVWSLRRPAAGRWLLTGGLLGLGMLCKPTLAAACPGLALGAVTRLWRSPRQLLVATVCGLLGLGLVVGPWVVRNHRVYDRWFFITASGGRQLWMGNHSEATGSTRWNPEPTGALRDSVWSRENPVDRDRYYTGVALRWMREHPARALRLYLIKMGNLWALYPRTQTVTRYTVSAADWAQGVASVVVFAGALLGLGAALRRGLAVWPWAVLSYTLVASLVLTVMRYRMAVEVILLWLAGLGYASLLGRRRG